MLRQRLVQLDLVGASAACLVQIVHHSATCWLSAVKSCETADCTDLGCTLSDCRFLFVKSYFRRTKKQVSIRLK